MYDEISEEGMHIRAVAQIAAEFGVSRRIPTGRSPGRRGPRSDRRPGQLSDKASLPAGTELITRMRQARLAFPGNGRGTRERTRGAQR